MSLGQNYNNNNKKNDNSPTVYSKYKMNNAESAVDPSSMGFTFWNSMLKISIAPRKQTNNDEIAFDYNNAVAIYLDHNKARILHDEILRFLSDPETYNNSGVPSGQGLITISNGKEFGVSTPCMVIRKLNDAVVESSYAYQFKHDYYYAIRNYDESTSDFNKVTEDYKDIEIQQLLTVLRTYYEAMSNAMAYSVIEQGKYDQTRVMNSLESIANKLGVSKASGGNRGGSKPFESIFNRKPVASSNNSVSEIAGDIVDQLEG